jgi:hypothetical protein
MLCQRRGLFLRNVLRGIVYSFIAAVGFSLLASLAICFGLDAETRSVSDCAAPLAGIFAGAWLASRNGSLKTGFFIGLAYIVLWFVFWMYLMARWNFVEWVRDGIPRVTFAHLGWWLLALLAALLGSYLRRRKRSCFFGIMAVTIFIWAACAGNVARRYAILPADPMTYFHVERNGSPSDGTVAYSLTVDVGQIGLSTLVYDCDYDYENPRHGTDSNTSFLGLNLGTLVSKLNSRLGDGHVLCAINGGFFGASGWTVAHHEEPMNTGGEVRYDVDVLRPKDQAWFFAVQSVKHIQEGQSRFVMAPSIPWNELTSYETVLGGVRPLRFEGKSLPLVPGAGGTGLRCSRTSIGWSADGNKLYILAVHDPDGEGASQIQRRMHWTQTGGWDVPQVQQYWEKKGVPFALLFDGGESSQLTFETSPGTYHELDSGYQYSFTLGYIFRRPLVATLPILPPSEAHRGVLNYLFVSDTR